MRVAVFGTGYWAAFQVGAWQALGADVVAVWNRTAHRAQEFAARFGIPHVFDMPEEVFSWGQFDVADIIADVGAHRPLVELAARSGKAVICQKPMAATLEDCRAMVAACEQAGVWNAVHENFRYQPPTVAFNNALGSGVIGKPLRAHISMRSPDLAIMEKQPALTTMPHMVLRDMGPHIFDVARCFFGEMRSIFALPIHSYPQYSVPDAALCTLHAESGAVLHCDLVHDWNDRFFAEGTLGTLRLDHENILHTTTRKGTVSVDTKTWQPLLYIPVDDWHLHGGHVFASIPACLADLMRAWEAGQPAPTSGADNLKTMELVFAAIQSFDTGNNIDIKGDLA